MKIESARPPILSGPSEDDIRAYAYNLYEQSNCAPGHDLDHWLEATACLNAKIAARHSDTQRPQHGNGPDTDNSDLCLLTTEARILAS